MQDAGWIILCKKHFSIVLIICFNMNERRLEVRERRKRSPAVLPYVVLESQESSPQRAPRSGSGPPLCSLMRQM
jgi:hypothetical protein